MGRRGRWEGGGGGRAVGREGVGERERAGGMVGAGVILVRSV